MKSCSQRGDEKSLDTLTLLDRDTQAPKEPSNGGLTRIQEPPCPREADSNGHGKTLIDFTVSTPINVDRLAQELADHPDQNFVTDLIKGLREGFFIGYTGPERDRISPNLKSANEHPDIVNAYLTQEIQSGRIGGPYDEPPFPHMQCHLIGVVPKKEPRKWRTILHLSYPEGDSINDFIPKVDYTLHYVTVDSAISIIKTLGWGAWLSKVDIESTFRIIPLHPRLWHLLRMSWNGKFYFDKRLTMGGRSSLFEFDKLPTALEWICQYKCLIEYILHLLDDFLTIEPPGIPLQP